MAIAPVLLFRIFADYFMNPKVTKLTSAIKQEKTITTYLSVVMPRLYETVFAMLDWNQVVIYFFEFCYGVYSLNDSPKLFFCELVGLAFFLILSFYFHFFYVSLGVHKEAFLQTLYNNLAHVPVHR